MYIDAEQNAVNSRHQLLLSTYAGSQYFQSGLSVYLFMCSAMTFEILDLETLF